MPAFVRSVKESMPGFGMAANNGSIVGNAQGAGTVTMTIPATGATTPSGGTAFNTNGGPAPSRGKGRVRVTAVNAGTAVTSVKITVTDGTTTLVVQPPTGATANGDLVDFSYDFNTDLGITSTTLTVVLTGGTGGTIDWEVSMT